MAKKKENTLKQTKGSFTLSGKVTGVDRDGYYKEGETKNGAEYLRMNFGVKTSNTQTVYVESFGMEPENVYLFSNNRELKYPDNMMKLEYSKWLDEKEELAEEGWNTTDLVIGLERDDSGKLINQINTTKYDGLAQIYDDELLYNGQDVTVIGDLVHRSYENRQGKTTVQTAYEIRKIYGTRKEIDFDSDKFAEVATFKQEFIYNDFDYDKTLNKITIYGWSVDYNGKPTPVTFVVDASEDLYNMEESEKKETVEAVQGVIEAIRSKALKYGQICSVHGIVVNKALSEESEDDTNALGALAGKRERKIVSYQRELAILGFNEIKDGYSEDEILDALDSNTLITETKEDKKDNLNGLGGRKTQTKFEEFEDDMDDDDLPF